MFFATPLALGSGWGLVAGRSQIVSMSPPLQSGLSLPSHFGGDSNTRRQPFKISIIDTAHHRNGIGGALFHMALFDDVADENSESRDCLSETISLRSPRCEQTRRWNHNLRRELLPWRRFRGHTPVRKDASPTRVGVNLLILSVEAALLVDGQTRGECPAASLTPIEIHEL
jgi:hypothetical protein